MRTYVNDPQCGRHDFDSLRLQNTAIALGQFDSMHIGHIEIIKSVIENAKVKGLTSLVYMFINDPDEVIFGKCAGAVNSFEKRLEILKDLGVDAVAAQRFDKELMELDCGRFAKDYLYEKFGARYVAAGFNYRFGKGGRGGTEILRSECGKFGIEVNAVPEVRLDGEAVSSTIIREKIIGGDVAAAARMMGRYFSVKGIVVEGNKIGGKLLGFPTANMNIPTDCIFPKFGVYISAVKIDGKYYSAITNIGGKPTVENDYQCIETHIDGSFGELYGREIEVEFCDYIRGITKFNSLEALAEQLKNDKEKAREFFAKCILKDEGR